MFGNWRSSTSSEDSTNHKKDPIQKAIEDDRRLYPHCGYSTQQSTSCSSSAESGYVCETINRIQRLCPNEKPVTILKSNDTSKNPKRFLDSDDNDDNNTFLPNFLTGKKSIFGDFFASTPADPFQRLEDIEKDLRGIVAGHQSSKNKFPSVTPSLGDKESDHSIFGSNRDHENDNKKFTWSRKKGPETPYDPKSIERV